MNFMYELCKFLASPRPFWVASEEFNELVTKNNNELQDIEEKDGILHQEEEQEETSFGIENVKVDSKQQFLNKVVGAFLQHLELDPNFLYEGSENTNLGSYYSPSFLFSIFHLQHSLSFPLFFFRF